MEEIWTFRGRTVPTQTVRKAACKLPDSTAPLLFY